MMGILRLFGGSKMLLIIIAVLTTTTLALGGVSKYLYDGKKSAQRDLEHAVTAFEQATNQLNAEIASQEARYDALAVAFKGQQKDYAAARVEANKLRKQINELASASPEVQELVDTPVPPDLYERVFSPRRD